ncbi:hypothetical protein CG723_44410 [Streptomyces sp. CB01635]|uniref:hypothetical protein n=1 Tax=unclassified Streptomyces TaxID=2593676 RepID=UPI000C26FA12|nr:hypothetical protein [Streptomyces sp. CB01635]PJN05491.1 hypothetical protein CG723_44410 [Streptomyces sp. CB01635]
MHVIETAKIPWSLVSKSNRPGRVHRKLVHEGEVSPGVGYTADLVRYEGGHGTFNAPRHKHNFDQIRYTVSGTPDFGHYQVSSEGQSVFFPAGAAYGPETIEEAEILLIQWGEHWVSRAQHDETYAQMQQKGEFRDGYYITVGADGTEHRADGRNAVWEAFNQRKLVYPTPRHPQPVMMEPEGFAWRSIGRGVSTKTLGRFTEDDVYVANYRWDVAGGVLDLTAERTQLLWIIDGGLSVDGVAYEPHTVIFSDFGETTSLVGTVDAHAVVFGLPLPAPVAVS